MHVRIAHQIRRRLISRQIHMAGHPRPLLLQLHLPLHLLLVLLLLLGRRRRAAATTTTEGKTLLAACASPAIDTVSVMIITSLISVAVTGGSRAAARPSTRGKGRGMIPGDVRQRREDFELVSTGVVVVRRRAVGGRRRRRGHGFLACVVFVGLGSEWAWRTCQKVHNVAGLLPIQGKSLLESTNAMVAAESREVLLRWLQRRLLCGLTPGCVSTPKSCGRRALWCAGCNVRWAIRKLWLDAPILVPVCRGHYRFSGPACGVWLVDSVVSIGLVFVCG